MIDWQQARQLQDDVGKDEMAEVVDLFLSEVDEAIGLLQDEYESMEAKNKSAAFHFLKGCASNLGFREFGDQCSQGEAAINAGGKPAFQIPDLVMTYTESKQLFMGEYQKELG